MKNCTRFLKSSSIFLKFVPSFWTIELDSSKKNCTKCALFPLNSHKKHFLTSPQQNNFTVWHVNTEWYINSKVYIYISTQTLKSRHQNNPTHQTEALKSHHHSNYAWRIFMLWKFNLNLPTFRYSKKSFCGIFLFLDVWIINLATIF